MIIGKKDIKDLDNRHAEISIKENLIWTKYTWIQLIKSDKDK
jgi:hypothetical protein